MYFRPLDPETFIEQMRIGNANYYKHFTLGKKNCSESF